jgi:cytoskeleton protein RodZ
MKGVMTDQLLQDSIPDSVGKLLQKAREAQGLSLEDVAKILCINKKQLGKFESDHENLVCDVYTLGFLRSYAKLLNLDADSILHQFKSQNSSSLPIQLVFPTPLSKRGMPSFRILAFSLFVLVSVGVGYEWVRRTHHPSVSSQEMPLVAEIPQKNPDLEKPVPLPEKTIASAPQENPLALENSLLSQNPSSPALSKENLPVSLPEEAAQPPLMEHSIPPSVQPTLLKVTEESWVEVNDEQGNTIVSRLFHPEETYEFKNAQNFLLKTGNARGIHLTSGEKELAFPGNQGEVKSGISLNPDTWID